LIDDKDSVQLSEYCFNVCEVLKTVTLGRDVDSLDESVRVALKDLERCVDQSRSVCSSPSNSRVTGEIERTLRRGANMPRVKHNRGKVEGHRLKVQEILDTLNAPSAPPDEAPHAGPRDIAASSISESCVSSALLSPILSVVLIISPFSIFIL